MINKGIKFDIVFWAHGHSEIERFLPLMAGLKTKGIGALLFYQNYDFRDGLTALQKKIIKKHDLVVFDYSRFLNRDLSLKLISLFVRIFKHTLKIRLFYDKFRGLRSKILQGRITENFIREIISKIGPKISFFDNISLVEFSPYPYGSFYIKKISNELEIKCFSIYHGGTVHIPASKNKEKSLLYFDKIYVPDAYVKEWVEEIHADENTKIALLGDPRFDVNWKNEIKNLFSQEVGRKISKIGISKPIKILYLSSNLEHLGREPEKYRHLDDIVRLAKSLNNMELLIKPHPRYRDEAKIKKIMLKNDFKDFAILEDDPLICYLDFVDFIVTLGTSALQDILPQGHKKIVIYDNFSESMGLENIFTRNLKSFNSYEGLYDFFNNRSIICNKTDDSAKSVSEFSRKWVGGDKGIDTVIQRITDDICAEIQYLK